MVKLLDWLGLIRGVYLLDYNYNVYSTWVKPNRKTKGEILFHFSLPYEHPVSWVYPLARVGHVVLLPDGTVEQPHYMKRWRYKRET